MTGIPEPNKSSHEGRARPNQNKPKKKGGNQALIYLDSIIPMMGPAELLFPWIRMLQTQTRKHLT
jgi:hypothetical protein